ncbi:MAG TPA: GDSL-type esterase/lipase family protein [Acidobacteriota bacterium]|nr:GDSL-type esterase/lipase family protein [Acidobacteriota bacterium]
MLRKGSIHARTWRTLLVSLLFGVALFGVLGMRSCPRQPIRVACVGDSITRGHGIPNPEEHGYPAVLGRLLGPGYNVRNFGHGGVTMLSGSGRPYRSVPEFQAATDFQPNIVVMMLGTNDAHPPEWQERGAQFADDCRALIDHFAGLPSSPTIWLCLPAPLIPGRDDERMTNLHEKIMPLLRAVAKEKQVGLIDVYSNLVDCPELFPDKVHPNAAGAAIIAETVARAILAR